MIIIELFYLLDKNVKTENEVNSKQDSVNASKKVTLTASMNCETGTLC